MPFINNSQFARWFRNAAPYIRMHRDKTFVIGLPDDCIGDINTASITDDIQLLYQLGIKIVVVHGTKIQLNNIPDIETKEVFSTSEYEDTLISTASAVGADKLIIFTDSLPDLEHSYSIYHPEELSNILDNTQLISIATKACNSNIKRTHILNVQLAGVLLQELYSSTGQGLLVTNEITHRIRRATIDDINAIFDLIDPLMQQGILLNRDIETIENLIDNYYLVIQDEIIVGCAALIDIDECRNEVASIATHDDHQDAGYASILVEHLEKVTVRRGKTGILAFTTQADEWFSRRGYESIDISCIPDTRKARYCEYRASKILEKNLLAK